MEHSHLLLSESQNVRFSFPLCINDLEPSSAQGSTCPFHVSSISNLSTPTPAPRFGSRQLCLHCGSPFFFLSRGAIDNNTENFQMVSGKRPLTLCSVRKRSHLLCCILGLNKKNNPSNVDIRIKKYCNIPFFYRNKCIIKFSYEIERRSFYCNGNFFHFSFCFF